MDMDVEAEAEAKIYTEPEPEPEQADTETVTEDEDETSKMESESTISENEFHSPATSPLALEDAVSRGERSLVSTMPNLESESEDEFGQEYSSVFTPMLQDLIENDEDEQEQEITATHMRTRSQVLTLTTMSKPGGGGGGGSGGPIGRSQNILGQTRSHRNTRRKIPYSPSAPTMPASAPGPAAAASSAAASDTASQGQSVPPITVTEQSIKELTTAPPAKTTSVAAKKKRTRTEFNAENEVPVPEFPVVTEGNAKSEIKAGEASAKKTSSRARKRAKPEVEVPVVPVEVIVPEVVVSPRYTFVDTMFEAAVSPVPKARRGRGRVGPSSTMTRRQKAAAEEAGTLTEEEKETTPEVEPELIEVAGPVYEDGEVWEVSPPPPPVPNSKKETGILKTKAKSRRGRPQQPQVETGNEADAMVVDELEAEPQQQTPKKSIAFKPETRIRYYHSPSVAAKKTTKAIGVEVSGMEQLAELARKGELGRRRLAYAENTENGMPETAGVSAVDAAVSVDAAEAEQQPLQNQNNEGEPGEEVALGVAGAEAEGPEEPVIVELVPEEPEVIVAACNNEVATEPDNEPTAANSQAGATNIAQAVENAGLNASTGNAVAEVNIVAVQNAVAETLVRIQENTSQAEPAAIVHVHDNEDASLGFETQIETQDSVNVFVNSETGVYSQLPVYPLLNDCRDPVGNVIGDLTHHTMRGALEERFKSVGILTVGDLSRQSEADLVNWPIIAPKYGRTYKALDAYFIKQNQPRYAIPLPSARKSTPPSNGMNSLLTRPILNKPSATTAAVISIHDSIINEIATDPSDIPTHGRAPISLASVPFGKRPALAQPKATTSARSRAGPRSQNTATAEGTGTFSSGFNGNGSILSSTVKVDPASIENLIRSWNNQTVLQMGGAEHEINFESLSVLRSFMAFLQNDSDAATEFLRMVLSKQPIAEKALRLLVESSSFESKVWNVYNTHPTKSPNDLLGSFMNEGTTTKYSQAHGQMFENLSTTFWTEILEKLQQSYVETSPFSTDAGSSSSSSSGPPISPLTRQFKTVLNFLTKYIANTPSSSTQPVKMNSIEELNALVGRSIPVLTAGNQEDPETQKALLNGAKLYMQSMSLESISQLFTSMLNKK